MPQKIVFVAGLDYPKDKNNKSTGYISKEKQADYLKKGFPKAEVTTFKYNAKDAEIKKAIGVDKNAILVLFSAGCGKAFEMAKYFSNKQLPLKNIHVNEPYTCDSGIFSIITSAKAQGIPDANFYSGGTDCTGGNVKNATVLKGRTSHNQSQEPLGKLLEQNYPELPPEKKEEVKKEEVNKEVEDASKDKPKDATKEEVKTDGNTDSDVAKNQKKEDEKVEQEKKLIEDGYVIADGEYTFEFEDEETMSVVGPNGVTVTWPDGSSVDLKFLYKTAMPEKVPKDTEKKTEEKKEQDNTSSKDAEHLVNSEQDKQETKKQEEKPPAKKNNSDTFLVAIKEPKSDNDKKVTGTITFKKKGPLIAAVGKLSGFPDGGTLEHEGQEASSFTTPIEALVKEMLGILEDMIENKYNVDIKLDAKPQ